MKRLFLFFFMIISSLSMPLMWAMDDPNPVPTDEEELSTVFSDEREKQKILDLQNMAKRLKEWGGKDSGMRSYFLLMLDQLNRDRVERGLTPIPELALPDIIGHADSLWPLTKKMQSWLAYKKYSIVGIYTFAISSSSKYLWIQFFDNTAQLYDVSNMEPVGEAIVLRNTHNQITFSPDDKYLGVYDVEQGGFQLYYTANMKRVWEKEIEESRNEVFLFGDQIKFSPDWNYFWMVMNQSVLVKYETFNINLDSEKYIEFEDYIDFKKQIICAEFSPDAKYVWISTYDSNDRSYEGQLYDTSRMKPIGEKINDIRSVKFSSDGKYLWCEGGRATGQLYDVPNMNPAVKNIDKMSYVEFSPNAKYVWIQLTNETGQLYDMSDMQPIGNKFDNIYHDNFVFSPDEKYIYLKFADETGGQLYATSDMKAIGEKIEYQAMYVTFSPDSKYICITLGVPSVKVFSVPDAKLMRGIFDNVTDVTFSPDSNYVVMRTMNGTKLYKMSNMKDIRKGLFDDVSYILFSPDSNYVWMKDGEAKQLARFNLKVDQELKKLTRDELKLIAYRYDALFNDAQEALSKLSEEFPEKEQNEIYDKAPKWLQEIWNNEDLLLVKKLKKEALLDRLLNESKTATELIPLTKEETEILEGLPQETQDIYAPFVKKWEEE